MKKNILLLMISLFSLSFLFASQALTVKVLSGEDANGSIYVSEPNNFQNISITIIEGLNTYIVHVADSVDPNELYISVDGSTSWGAYDQEPASYDPYYHYFYVQLSFERPHNLSYYIYSNIPIDSALVNIKPINDYVIDSQITNLKKGWNKILFEDFFYGGLNNEIESCHAEVTAEGVAGEIYTINSSNNYSYNEETDCYENSDVEFTFENKLFHPGWNWESFPKLDRQGNDGISAISVFTNISPYYSKFNWDGENKLNLVNNNWDQGDFQLRSSDGGKLRTLPPENRIYVATGTELSPTTTINLSSGWNWIGYWLPHSEMCDVAFGEHWNNVESIEAEDWYYDAMFVERGGDYSMPLPSNKPKPMHYGEGYYIRLKEAIPNFQWHIDNSLKSENFEKKEPDNYTYIKKANYEVIDIIDIDSEIKEIGVFEEGVCVGGVKVDETSEQILVYSENANRGTHVFTFEVLTERGISQNIYNYQIFNLDNNEFQNGHVIAGNQNYSIVKFEKNIGNNSNSTQNSIIHSCYPNPFKVSGSRSMGTTISYTLPQDENVQISIYNIKGQKVKNLDSGFKKQGHHSVVWNGKDTNERNVGTGIFFYKIMTEQQTVINKILLIK